MATAEMALEIEEPVVEMATPVIELEPEPDPVAELEAEIEPIVAPEPVVDVAPPEAGGGCRTPPGPSST